jgi:hypothetical protein
MPEALKFIDMPGFMAEFHIEPFRNDYIPGSIVLHREKNEGGEDVFFQIPTPVAQKLNELEMEKLRKQLHAWWEARAAKV